MSFYIRLTIFSAIIGVACLGSGPADAGQERRSGQNVPDAFRATDQTLPRFVSLASDKVYMRAGPARDYPVQWVYERKNLPLEITLEYDSWRKVRDPDGATGWIHHSLLSPRRYARIESSKDAVAREAPDNDSQPSMRLEPGAIVRLKQCDQLYCEVASGDYQGWVKRKMLWGIYADEKLD